MWRATVLTLFPDMFPGPLGLSLAGEGLARGLWACESYDIRTHGIGRHRAVDDTPAGGGAGMVMRADVLAAAIDAAAPSGDPRPRLLMSPRGRPLDQARVKQLAAGPGVALLCGRFEGVDERVIAARGLEEVSIGDFVLSGGEIAALTVLDACIRLRSRHYGKTRVGSGREFRERPTRISALHAPAGFRRSGDPSRLAGGRPRPDRGLAPSRGRTTHP